MENEEDFNPKEIKPFFKEVKDTIKWKYQEAQKDRFRIINGYKLDKWLFRLGMYSTYIVIFLILYMNHFDLDYFRCSANDPNFYVNGEMCRNPFYKEDNWKSYSYLGAGDYGLLNSKGINDYAFFGVFVLFGTIGIINHRRYNKHESDIDKGVN
jgi:hypothetical protein